MKIVQTDAHFFEICFEFELRTGIKAERRRAQCRGLSSGVELTLVAREGESQCCTHTAFTTTRSLSQCYRFNFGHCFRKQYNNHKIGFLLQQILGQMNHCCFWNKVHVRIDSMDGCRLTAEHHLKLNILSVMSNSLAICCANLFVRFDFKTNTYDVKCFTRHVLWINRCQWATEDPLILSVPQVCG